MIEIAIAIAREVLFYFFPSSFELDRKIRIKKHRKKAVRCQVGISTHAN